jgi:hypothetical protein
MALSNCLSSVFLAGVSVGESLSGSDVSSPSSPSSLSSSLSEARCNLIWSHIVPRVDVTEVVVVVVTPSPAGGSPNLEFKNVNL